MSAARRRNRRAFQPSFEALSLRLAPSTVLPMPDDGTLDQTTMPEIVPDTPATEDEAAVDLQLQDSIPEMC